MTAIVTSKNRSRVTNLVKRLKIPIKNIVCPSKNLEENHIQTK